MVPIEMVCWLRVMRRDIDGVVIDPTLM
jgi:hypothetical protein